MLEDKLRDLLDQVRTGEVPVDAAVGRLKDLPYEDLGFARVDHHRALRQGFPEVIFCQGKTQEQILSIADRLLAHAPVVMATRVMPEIVPAMMERYPALTHHETARIVVLRNPRLALPPARKTRGYVLILSAGTADLAVAEEAAVTAVTMGSPVERLYDVGVAGIHRLLDQRDKLTRASVLVVAAGMDGALPSVVGGLVERPVVAVPTSVGYGASFHGLAALLTMLNSCASGVAVMNIDNGFGAGYFAHTVNLR